MFWPLVEGDERYLKEIVSPLAQAWALRPLGQPVRRIETLERKDSSSGINLQIVGDGDSAALHNTLLGVRSSIAPNQAIRLTLPWVEESVCRQVVEWVSRYDFQGEVEILPAHAAQAAAFHLRPQEDSVAWVAFKAGFIPPHGGWLADIASQLQQAPQTALIGLAPHVLHGQPFTGPLSADELRSLQKDDALVAVAASSDLLGGVAISAPACCTLGGAWVEWLIEVLEKGGQVLHHTSIDLWDTGPYSGATRFSVAADAMSLSKRAGVSQYTGDRSRNVN
jgi:hypothetical protein